MTMTPLSRLTASAHANRYIRRQKLQAYAFAALATLFAWLAMIYVASPASAHSRHHHHRYLHIAAAPANVIMCDNHGCMGSMTATLTIERRVHHARRARYVRVDANGNYGGVIGGRPDGCPPAYCGCGLRKYLGLSDKSLDLAWNWAVKFPRTFAHAGAAAVRHHHVMLLVAQVSGSIWTVRDYNGGRNLSYIHERDVSGYVFVEPRARLASNQSF